MKPEEYVRLRPLVNSPNWDLFLVYLTNMNARAHNDLENCNEVTLKTIQSKIAIYKELLTLRELVNSIKL